MKLEHPGMHGGVVDVGIKLHVDRIMDEAISLRGLDILVNNAGIAGLPEVSKSWTQRLGSRLSPPTSTVSITF
jgi:NAD(P)-dependent dehydrogenase (short-subunit alcohol dehydrogenase family)